MGCQGARFARRRSRLHPLTSHLAQEELSGGFKVSRARLEGVPSQKTLKFRLTMVHSKDGIHPTARDWLNRQLLDVLLAKV
jgi:hypothetical protein